MDETFEEYLLKQLDAPVILKDGSVAVDANGNPLTKEQAIATNLINNAMKGDIKSIQYINLLKQQSKRKQMSPARIQRTVSGPTARRSR